MVAAERFFDGKYDYILDLPDDEDDGEDDDPGPSSKAKVKVHAKSGWRDSAAADTRPGARFRRRRFRREDARRGGRR